jgi:hypothetical protein
MFPVLVLSAVYCSEVLFMLCLHKVHTMNISKGGCVFMLHLRDCKMSLPYLPECKVTLR